MSDFFKTPYNPTEPWKLPDDSFSLVNDNVPAAQKADPGAFLPTPPAQALRQSIYGRLKETPTVPVTLREFVALTNRPPGKVNAAAKYLVRKGFAIKTTIQVPRPTKKDPGGTRELIALVYVEPWTGKANKQW